jgi:hypothetical protein
MAPTTVASHTGEQLRALGVLLGHSRRTIESQISGTSMGSTLPAGSRIRIRLLPSESYRPGQVVAFVSGNAIFAHRIVFSCRQGVLTRGDNRPWCDFPLPWHAILGLVTESDRDGIWRPLPYDVQGEHERVGRRRAVDAMLRVSLHIDIRLARFTARTLSLVARWRHRLLSRTALQPGTGS